MDCVFVKSAEACTSCGRCVQHAVSDDTRYRKSVDAVFRKPPLNKPAPKNYRI